MPLLISLPPHTKANLLIVLIGKINKRDGRLVSEGLFSLRNKVDFGKVCEMCSSPLWFLSSLFSIYLG